MARVIILIAFFFLAQFTHVLASVWMLLAILLGRDRAWQIAIGYDHLGNAVTGGHPGETISSRAYRAAKEGTTWGCVLCRMLDKLDPNHCEKSSNREQP